MDDGGTDASMIRDAMTSDAPIADAVGSDAIDAPLLGLGQQRVVYGNGSTIFSIRLDGTGKKQLTNDPSGASFATVSLDGKYVVYVSNSIAIGFQHIVAQNTDGTGRRDITTSDTSDEYPALSADGQRVAFTSTRQGEKLNKVYVASFISGDAGPLARVSPDDGHEHRWPSWGGNSKITYTDMALKDIMAVDADGRNLVNLTNSPGIDDQLSAYSSDGSKIVFSSRRSNSYDVWVMNADGSEPRQVTTSGRAGGGVAFDLTGRYIVYYDLSSFDLGVITLDGATITTNLTNDSVNEMGTGVYPD